MDVDRSWMLLMPEQAPWAGDVQAAGVGPLALISPEGENPPGACACGLVESSGEPMEPYGERTFAQAAEDARRGALAHKRAGRDCLLLTGAQNLPQARAAVLGAREAGLPLLLALDLMGEGDALAGGGDILSAFVVLQELGLAAFGFRTGVTGIALPALERLQPYSRIPLLSMTQNMAEALPPSAAGELFARRARGLARLGVTVMAIDGAGRDQLLAAARTLAEAPGPAGEKINYLDREEVWAADEAQVYYLDAAMEYSPPMACQRDMADQVIQLEREGWDALCIRVDTPEDGDSILQNNIHLARLPVVFLSDYPAALGAALRAYHGRAIVDSRSALAPGELKSIAARYGAVVL